MIVLGFLISVKIKKKSGAADFTPDGGLTPLSPTAVTPMLTVKPYPLKSQSIDQRYYTTSRIAVTPII